MGLSSRRAIYIPFPQAVPCSYILNMDDCLGNNPIACGKCAEVCEKKAINYDDQDEMVTREVGRDHRGHRSRRLRPDRDGRVRLHPLRERDHLDGVRAPDLRRRAHRRPLRAALRPGAPEADRFHPVRRLAQPEDRQALLLQHLLHEHDQGHPAAGATTIRTSQNSVFYQDIRAFGKGFEDMFQRSKEAGTRYIRGLPGDIEEDPETRQPDRHRREHHLRQARASRARHGRAVGRRPALRGPRQDGEHADPFQDVGRLLHGVAPQAQTGGCADAGGLLRRFL